MIKVHGHAHILGAIRTSCHPFDLFSINLLVFDGPSYAILEIYVL